MASISTHVLDLVKGGPAQGVAVTLERLNGDAWISVGAGSTDADGRIKDLLPRGSTLGGTFRITFTTAPYFEAQGGRCFYPYVPIVFQVAADEAHYHVPLLLGPFGYNTYRGS